MLKRRWSMFQKKDDISKVTNDDNYDIRNDPDYIPPELCELPPPDPPWLDPEELKIGTSNQLILGQCQQVNNVEIENFHYQRDKQLNSWRWEFGMAHKRWPTTEEVAEQQRKILSELDNPEKGNQVHQPQNHRDRHTYIVGKSGSGKTTLLLNMIYQDLKVGNGLGVIAPEQEMITEQILPHIPEHRLDDIIYFNPADQNPIPFNPLHLNEGEDPDLKTDEVLTIFRRIVGSEGGQRMEEILRQSLSALIELPNTTLLDIPRLLDRENPHYRQQVISQLKNDYCAHFWKDTYPQYPKDAHLPIIHRLGRFIQPRVIRNTLCRTGKSLNFRKVMDTGKVVLFNLSDGILGEQNSQLLGQLIVSQFQQAVASRANIPQHQRRIFYLYIDEFQTFTSTATASYEKILSRARKYRLALILAHQQTGQIPTELLRDIFGNVSTMISFNVSHNDATKLSKEFLTMQDYQLSPTPPAKLVELQIGETYCKLGNEAFKMKTPRVTEKPNFDIAEQVIERSRGIYKATKPKGVDKPPETKLDDDVFSDIDPGDIF